MSQRIATQEARIAELERKKSLLEAEMGNMLISINAQTCRVAELEKENADSDRHYKLLQAQYDKATRAAYERVKRVVIDAWDPNRTNRLSDIIAAIRVEMEKL